MTDTIVTPAVTAPTPNTGAVNATDVPASGPSGATPEDRLSSLAATAIAETLKEQTPEPVTPPVEGATWNEAAGRWQKEGKFIAGEKPAAPVEALPVVEGEPVTEDAKDEVVLPEGMAAVKKIDRELVAQFKVLDGDGELEVPDITLEFEANGKTRREPIDKVVKLAQMGVYNHEREQRLVQTQQDMQQKDTQLQQWEARAREMEQDRERLLSDPDYLVSRLQQYERENTPEARLTREREQVERQRAEIEIQQLTTQGAQFFHSEIIPAVETITTALPYVSAEEIGAKLLLISERYKVQTPHGSYVPPTAYQLISRAVVEDVLPWAQQVNEARDTDRKTATASANKEAADAKAKAKAAQVTAQQKTNLIGRTVKPGTRPNVGSSTSTLKPAAPPANQSDMLDFIVKKSLAESTVG